MTNVRLSRALCAVVGEFLVGSHNTLNALFQTSGAPGEPPDLAHHSKWKEWLFHAGQDPKVDSLSVLGNILEEFMDVAPYDSEEKQNCAEGRKRVVQALEQDGFQYFQGGRVLPKGKILKDDPVGTSEHARSSLKPTSIEELLNIIVNGLPRAMYPLVRRRKDSVALSFKSEYDIQDLLHALLRPWIADIRAEEFTPSYAGSTTRMDFLLPAHSLVIETKLVRDRAHAKKIGDELIIDIAHYRVHPKCEKLWCVIYDPDKLIANAGGLKNDLEGENADSRGAVSVKVAIV